MSWLFLARYVVLVALVGGVALIVWMAATTRD